MSKSNLYTKAKVVKRNVLNELRSNNMTVQELRFFSIYLSKINSQDISTRVVRFPIEDFQRIMCFGKLNIAQLKASTNSLLQKIVSVPTERGGFTAFQLFKQCVVDKSDDDKWYVEIDAHDKALPLMFEFKNRFFKYELWNALRLKSPNQVRMYEILKQYEGLGKRELTIEELRELIGIGKNEYPRWDNFKRKVLDNCQQALKEFTDICYTYERGKVGKGGKWLSVVFYISKNTEYVDQITLDEFIKMQPKPEPLALDTANDTDEPEEVAQVYDNENISFLAEACKNEFSNAQMNCIFEIIATKPLPEMTGGIWFSRFHYLSQQYAKMNVYAKKTNIPNRYGYFVKMLQNDMED